MLTNEARFVSSGFNDERINREALAHWIRINTYAPITVPFQLSQTQLNLQDQLFNFADATMELDKTVFSVKPLSN